MRKKNIGTIKFCLVIALALLIGQAKSFASKPEYSDSTIERAKRLLESAVAAMGGESQLKSVKSVKVEAIGYLNMVEQSERPEGPYITSYEQTNYLLDLDNQKLSQTVEVKSNQNANWSPRTFVVTDGIAAAKSGDKYGPAGLSLVKDAETRIALGPERILLSALRSEDLRLERDTILMQGVPHHVVKFTWQKIPVTIFLNADTNLPTAVETVAAHPYEHFWTVWGDVPTRTFYSYWTLEDGGIRFPRQWDIEQNGLPLRKITITDLKINPAIVGDVFNIPENIRAYVKQNAQNLQKTIDDLPLGIPNQQPQEIAPGIVKISGRWDVAFVRQKDGVIIIEAPISSAYSAKVLDEAKRRFPNLPVKAVISTADSFPHIGGVREYAARGIPIYALDANRPLLERMLAAPHHFYPDLLETKPRKANFKIVSGKTIIGEGENRLELYPIRSEAGERMLMVYFPESKILYAADLVQKLRDGSFFMTEYLDGLMKSVNREKLTVEKVFAMHSELLRWSEIQTPVGKVSSPVQIGTDK